jgi:hypothetical protein
MQTQRYMVGMNVEGTPTGGAINGEVPAGSRVSLLPDVSPHPGLLMLIILSIGTIPILCSIVCDLINILSVTYNDLLFLSLIHMNMGSKFNFNI